MNNRLHNCKNPYQGDALKVLCVCSAGLLRSPTLANVLHKEYGFNTRAVGVVASHALIPLDSVLIHWADKVIFVDEEAAAYAGFAFNSVLEGKSVTLNIPDQFEYNAPELVAACLEQCSEYFYK